MAIVETITLVLSPHGRWLIREQASSVVHYMKHNNEDVYCGIEGGAPVELLERDDGHAVTCVRCLGFWG